MQQLRGLVADDPVPRGRTTSLTLSDVLVRSGQVWEPLDARILVSVPHWPQHEYGEYLQVRGRLQPLSGSGAIEALQRQGVLASISYPRVSYLANPQANPILLAMFRLRQRLGNTISQTLPEPEASTLKATVLGLRSALAKDEQQALVDTGTVHLVAISGFKLSLLAAALQILGLFVLRRTTARIWARLAVAAAVLAAIASYTLLTGASPSAVRAAIMAMVVVLAALAGRPHDQVAALALAIFAIVAASPFELQDGGLQLSCLSVLGIALLAEPLATRIRRPLLKLPERLHPLAALLAEAVAVSLAATAFDLPVLAGSFHVVSLVSPIANLLGMPLLWPIMIFGGLGALFGSVLAPVGALLLWPAWAFMTLLDWIVHISASLPYAALPISGLSPAAAAAYYALLLTVVCWLRRGRAVKEPRRRAPSRRLAWSGMATGAALVTAATIVATRPPDTLRATFLAVPGQAALIQTPTGKKVLIDGGQDGPALLRQLGQLLPPWDRGIDVVIVTSPRLDHIGGLEAVFARYTVGALIAPEVPQPTATFRRIKSGVQQISVDAVDLGAGAALRHLPEGWKLRQGETLVLLAESGADVQTPSGNFRILPIAPTTRPDEDNVLSLADTGNVTVTFGGLGIES